MRAARHRAGLSLSALAEASGVGKGSLSELENGTRNPTLATLYALAGPLRVPLATLLADVAGAAVDDGGVRARLLESRPEAGAVREVYSLDLEPGADREALAHGSGVVEHLLVTAGSLLVGRLGQERTVTAGDWHRWESDAPHVYRSIDGASGVLTILTPDPGGVA